MKFETFLLFVAIFTIVMAVLGIGATVFAWVLQGRSSRAYMDDRRKGARLTDHRFDPKQFRGRR